MTREAVGIYIPTGPSYSSRITGRRQPHQREEFMNLLGIDIGGTKTSVCVGNIRGEIAASKKMAMASVDSVEAYRRQLLELCFGVMDKAGVKPEALDAVGISAPGPLDVKRGVLIAPPNNPGWRDVPIVEMVRKSIRAPVYFNNDANACALAEDLFGEFRGTRNLVYLTFSTGIGGGIIANGELIQGATDTGGEVGHHIIDPAGPPCGCGNRGCWEAFVGGRNLAERLKQQIREGNIRTAIVDKAGSIDAIDMRAFELAAREGDRFAIAEWDQFTERMAQGIGNLIMILNPDVVVLGTIAIHAGDFVMAPIRDKLPKYTWEWPLKACKVVASSLGGKIGDLSALAVAVTGLRHADA
jgi:glucokinase